MEQEKQEQQQDFDLGGFGLGAGLPAPGGDSWDTSPPDPLPGLHKGLDDLSGITGLLDVEPLPGEEGQVPEEAKVTRDDTPVAIVPSSEGLGPTEGAEGSGLGEMGVAPLEGSSTLAAPAPASSIMGDAVAPSSVP